MRKVSILHLYSQVQIAFYAHANHPPGQTLLNSTTALLNILRSLPSSLRPRFSLQTAKLHTSSTPRNLEAQSRWLTVRESASGKRQIAFKSREFELRGPETMRAGNAIGILEKRDRLMRDPSAVRSLSRGFAEVISTGGLRTWLLGME